MFATTCLHTTWISSNATCAKRLSGKTRKGLEWYPAAGRLFLCASSRRRASWGCGCPTASKQAPGPWRTSRKPNASMACRLQRSLVNGPAPSRGSVAPREVLTASSMPGELLVQASDGAVVASTLVLGCLFSMLGAQPEGSLARRRATTEYAAAAATAASGLGGQPRVLPPISSGRAAAASMSSESGGAAAKGSGSGSNDGGVTGPTCGSHVTYGSAKPDPGAHEGGMGIGRDSSDEGRGGSSSGSDWASGLGVDTGRRNLHAEGGDGRHGYGNSGGGGGGSGGGRGRGGSGDGQWRGFGAGEADDGAPGSGVVIALCVALGTAAALMAGKVKLLLPRLAAGPLDTTPHHRRPAQLAMSTSRPLQQQLQQLPLPWDVKDSQEQPRLPPSKRLPGEEPLLQQQQQQQQQQQRQEQHERCRTLAEAAAPQSPPPGDARRLAEEGAIIAVAAAGVAGAITAASGGGPLCIRCRIFSGNPRGHCVGTAATAAASAAEPGGPWPAFSPLELDSRGGPPGAASQPKLYQHSSTTLYTPLQQQGARRPIAAHRYSSWQEGDSRGGGSGQWQQAFEMPTGQQGPQPRRQQEGASPGGLRGGEADSSSSSSSDGSSSSSSPDCVSELCGAEASRPSVRRGLIAGRSAPVGHGAALPLSPPAGQHGEQPRMQQLQVPLGFFHASTSISNDSSSTSSSADCILTPCGGEALERAHSGFVAGGRDAPSGLAEAPSRVEAARPIPVTAGQQQKEQPRLLQQRQLQQQTTRPVPRVRGADNGSDTSAFDMSSSSSSTDCATESCISGSEAPQSLRPNRGGLIVTGGRSGSSFGSGAPFGRGAALPVPMSASQLAEQSRMPPQQLQQQPQLQQQQVMRAALCGCDVGSGNGYGSSSSSSDRSSGVAGDPNSRGDEATQSQPVRRGLIVCRDAPQSLGTASRQQQRRQRGQALQPGGGLATCDGLVPSAAAAIAVELLPTPKPMPTSGLAPRAADVADAAPRGAALAAAARGVASSSPFARAVDVGVGVGAEAMHGRDRGSLGGGAGVHLRASVGLCDEIAALGVVQRGLEGAHRRADRWLAAGVPSPGGAGSGAAAAVVAPT